MMLPKRARVLALIAAVALTVPSLPSMAQEISETHLQAARAAIDAIEATDEFDNILPQAAHALKGELIQQSPNLEELISATVDEKALELAARRRDLEHEAALAYARIFDQEELESIAEFYSSSAGQKLLSDGPIVTREVYEAAEIWRRGVIRDLANGVTETLQAAVGSKAPEIGATTDALAEGATDSQ